MCSSYEGAAQYIQKVCQEYGRYRRDQLLLFQKVAIENPDWLSLALEKCIQEKLYSANEFRDVVGYFKRTKKETDMETVAEVERKQTVTIEVQTRDLQEYIHRMGGK